MKESKPGQFTDLNLSPEILKALEAQNYREPSPVQTLTIPPVLEKRDVLAAAQTGTGKTAAFVLPILELLSKEGRTKSNNIRALILVPTRELAAQVYESIVKYSRFLRLKSTVVHGGVKINPQMLRMTKGQDILVATPGRLLDLYRQNAVKFDQLEILVLDEADRMLNLGFKDEITELHSLIPEKRQTLMFTATFTDELKQLSDSFVHDPVKIEVNPEEITVEAIEQLVYPVDKMKKTALFIQLYQAQNRDKTLVFTKTKNRANHLVEKLEKAGIEAEAIHGDKSQGARTRALDEFKADKISVLVATDLAARGLDISQLPLVVNFDMPHLKEDYIHRIGRTGRANAAGLAISFVDIEEFQKLKDIERLTKQVINRVIIPGFELDPPLPESNLDLRPFKVKKPKKAKKMKTDQSS
jgi:ATP-dependent RNA helicase RhlE